MRFNASFMMEDTAAHGLSLGFPNVSSCVAVVINMPPELVGWHVTAGTLASIAVNRTSAQGAAKFIEYSASAASAGDLLIVGHVENHDPAAIRDWVNTALGVTLPARASDITHSSKAKQGGEYHIFFKHTGGADPKNGVQKTKSGVKRKMGSGLLWKST